MVTLPEVAAPIMVAVLVGTEVALIVALRSVTREIRTARADVMRALALLGVGNLIVANMVRRPERAK